MSFRTANHFTHQKIMNKTQIQSQSKKTPKFLKMCVFVSKKTKKKRQMVRSTCLGASLPSEGSRAATRRVTGHLDPNLIKQSEKATMFSNLTHQFVFHCFPIVWMFFFGPDVVLRWDTFPIAHSFNLNTRLGSGQTCKHPPALRSRQHHFAKH